MRISGPRVFHAVAGGVGLILFTLLVARLDFPMVKARLVLVGWWFPLVVALHFVALLLSSRAWQLFIARDRSRATFPELLAVFWAGHAVNYLTPTGTLGEVLRGTALQDEIEADELIASVISYNAYSALVSQAMVVLGPLQALVFLNLPRPLVLTLLVLTLRVLALQVLALLPPLDRLLPSDVVRGEQPLHHAAVARHLLRRDLDRHRGEPTAHTRPEREGAGALGEGAESRALPVEHLDASDAVVAIRIELDPRLGHAAGAAVRHLDHAGRAADAERGGRRGKFHVAGLGRLACHESDRAAHHVEQRGVGLASLLVDELVHGHSCVGTEVQGRLVVEGDGEQRTRAGLQYIVLVNGVADLQRSRCRVAARHGRAALQGGDLAYRGRTCRGWACLIVADCARARHEGRIRRQGVVP